MRLYSLFGALAALISAIFLSTDRRDSSDTSAQSSFYQSPFFAGAGTIKALDCPDLDCEGPLSFLHLMNSELYDDRKRVKSKDLPGKNPFVERPETRAIVTTVRDDISNIRIAAGSPYNQLDPNFLTSSDVRIQLVGIVNRMDRQFNAGQRESPCGEISLIYRFAYSRSRLPVTMNLVFPAAVGDLSCQEAAKRWITALRMQPTTDPDAFAAYLISNSGPLAKIAGKHIRRIELNMQVYRKPGSIDDTDFGSKAAYLIRVFSWSPTQRAFLPSTLPNEINRHALLCDPGDDGAICDIKNARRKALVEYLQQPGVVRQIDQGLLDLPKDLGVLAMRAISISPGGQTRSSNQPYWDAAIAGDRPESEIAREQIISQEEIEDALRNAATAGVRLEFIGNADDFRQRLNDSTCSGCHQARAIAGFHFPGADSPDVQKDYAANAVYLAGSPHFYADQPRRFEIVSAIARSPNGRVVSSTLATSFSARPHRVYETALAGTAYIGGWGGACTLPGGNRQNSKRVWGCKSGLTCKGLFESKNAPGIGTCVPEGRYEIGDHMQLGQVRTTGFGLDTYRRTSPEVAPAETNYIKRVFGLDEFDERKTTIDPRFYPPPGPTGNSFYASHQEFYYGMRGELYRSRLAECANGTRPQIECDNMARDRLSGGFPSGMLRLSECKDLPGEATCGMVASSGFNACMVRMGTQGFEDFDLTTCFDYFTAYAGMRACDISNPCRDDYICLAPMSPNPKLETDRLFEERLSRLQDPSPDNPYKRIIGRPYDPNKFGQMRPDKEWVDRNDRRGICIPPYFVFQFRSDRHPSFPSDESNVLNQSDAKSFGEF